MILSGVAAQPGCCLPIGSPKSIGPPHNDPPCHLEADADLCGRRDRAQTARVVSPETLEKAIDHTTLAHAIFHAADTCTSLNSGPAISMTPWEGDTPLSCEPRRRAALIVKLAAELFRREHGQAPVTAGALLGPYLKVIPEGIQKDEPIPDGIK